MLKPVLTKAFLQPAKAAAMCMTCLTRVRVREGLDRGLGLNSGLACHFLLNFKARISALLPAINRKTNGLLNTYLTGFTRSLLTNAVRLCQVKAYTQSWPLQVFTWPLMRLITHKCT